MAAWTLALIGLGFVAAALFFLLRLWVMAPLAALITAGVFLVIALILMARARQRTTGADAPDPLALVHSYPLESTALAFLLGFLLARSRSAARFLSTRVLAMVLRAH